MKGFPASELLIFILQEFLRKEFSEENILFWEACEDLRRFDPEDQDRMKEVIMSIYDRLMQFILIIVREENIYSVFS